MSQKMRAVSSSPSVPGMSWKLFGIREGEHVALLDPAEAVDGRTVELDTLLERGVELDRGDGDGLDLAEHVGEPEPHQADPSFFDGPQHVVLLVIHCVSILAPVVSVGVGTSPSVAGRTLPIVFTRRSQWGNDGEIAVHEPAGRPFRARSGSSGRQQLRGTPRTT